MTNLKDKAREAFLRVIHHPSGPHMALVDLKRAGWVEECPTPNSWRFTHRDFLGILVIWGHEGWVMVSE